MPSRLRRSGMYLTVLPGAWSITHTYIIPKINIPSLPPSCMQIIMVVMQQLSVSSHFEVSTELYYRENEHKISYLPVSTVLPRNEGLCLKVKCPVLAARRTVLQFCLYLHTCCLWNALRTHLPITTQSQSADISRVQL